MNRQDKEEIIASLKRDFSSHNASFVVNYSGLNVEQMTKLRNEVRRNGGQLKITKTTLMRRALHDTSVEGLSPYIKNQIALIFVQEDSTNIAKVLNEFAEKHDQLGIIAGWVFERVFDSKSVKMLASLPSREVLLAQLCATLNAPIAKAVRTLQAIIAKPVHAVQQIKEKKG